MTFLIQKQGTKIEFESAFGGLETASYYLKEYLPTNTFAMDLVSKANLSEKQIAWIHYLATEHLKKSLNEEEVPQEFKSLVEKMYAKVKSNSRKFKVNLPGNIAISTVNNGPNTGALYIFEDSNYIGKITPQGQLQLKVPNEDVKALLEDANENILKLAQLYGHQTGQCAICNRTLSDPLSIQMGIGPICAKRFS